MMQQIATTTVLGCQTPAMTPTAPTTSITLHDLSNFVACFSSGDSDLNEFLEASNDPSVWHRLLICIAFGSVQKAHITRYEFKLDGIAAGIQQPLYTHDEIYLNVGREFDRENISFDALRKQIRMTVVEHADWYPDNAEEVKVIKARVAIDDLHDFLLGKKIDSTAEERIALLHKNCDLIYQFFQASTRKGLSVFPQFIELDDDSHIVVMDQHFTFCSGDYKTTLDCPIAAAREYFLGYNLKKMSVPKIMFYECAQLEYSGWKGAIKIENNFSLEKNVSDNVPSRLVTDMATKFLNCQADFIRPPLFCGRASKIECRHLVLKVIIDLLKNSHGNRKIDWARYSTTESLSAHVSPDMQVIELFWSKVYADVFTKKRVENGGFGQELHALFVEMEETNKSFRAFALRSHDHAMAVWLQIVEGEDKPYMVNFYDPYFTNGCAVYKTHDLSELTNHTLELYVNGARSCNPNERSHMYGAYFPEPGITESIVIIECDLTSFTDVPTNLSKLKKSPEFPSEPITSQVIYNLSKEFNDDLRIALRECFHQFGTLPLEAQLAKLNVMAGVSQRSTSLGTSTLCNALFHGVDSVIYVYTEFLILLLKYLPKTAHDKIFVWLAAKDKHGYPGLYDAYTRGHVNAIIAYRKLVALMVPYGDVEKIVNLIEAKAPDGVSGLSQLESDQNPILIEQVNKLINLLPEGEITQRLHEIVVKKKTI